jgi:putative glutamine amidotransferase
VSARPLIGVSAQRFAPGRPFRIEAAIAIQSDYLDAVGTVGGAAVALLPEELDDAAADALVGRLDGLVLTGGPDVDPARYGQEPAPQTYGLSALQDGFEHALFEASRRGGVPVLAICRGLQVVNVACGGTLDQHIPDRPGVLAHGVPDGGGGSDNRYEIEPGTLLEQVLGASADGRCHHHQAVDEVAPGLVVSARTSDGIVEAVEYEDPAAAPHWMLAVQWHPEETFRDDARLFAALVEAACTAAR